MKFVIENSLDLRARISYPEYLDSFDTVEHRCPISSDDLLSNKIAILRAKRMRSLSTFGYPYDPNVSILNVSSSLFCPTEQSESCMKKIPKSLLTDFGRFRRSQELFGISLVS